MMFVEYEFERDFADKAFTLEHVISQVGADMGVYVFLQLSELSEFAEIAQQYKGHVAWVEDVASGPLGFLVDDPVVGLIEFSGSVPDSDPVGAFFSTDFPHSGVVMVSDTADFPVTVRPVLVEEYRPMEHAGEESGDVITKLMHAGALLVYRLDFAGVAGALQEEVFIDTNNRGLVSGLL
jgi:hypothetical protein